MLKVNICGVEERYREGLDSWVKEQYHNRRKQGADFWFRVIVNVDGRPIVFASANAPSSGGGGLIPTGRESEVISLWEELEVKKKHDVNLLLKFLRKVSRLF